MPENFYQTVNFHFKVVFNFNVLKKPIQELSQHNEIDVSFQSVSGLDATLETEPIKEGGENRFEHVIPVRRKYGPLILKRGLLTKKQSSLTNWLKAAFDDEKVQPVESVTISLLNENHDPLMYWTLSNVWPRSWKIGTLDAEQGAVLIETLELNYNTLIFDIP